MGRRMTRGRLSCRCRAGRREQETAATRAAEAQETDARGGGPEWQRAQSPTMRGPAACAGPRTGDSPDRVSARALLPKRASEHVFERRHARAEMPHLHTLPRGNLKQHLCRLMLGHEYTHHLARFAITFDPGLTKGFDKTSLVTL